MDESSCQCAKAPCIKTDLRTLSQDQRLTYTLTQPYGCCKGEQSVISAEMVYPGQYRGINTASHKQEDFNRGKDNAKKRIAMNT